MEIRKFDKWFNKQTTLIQVVLLLIPIVGWVVEALIRLAVMLRTKSVIHIAVFLFFVFIGWTWVFCVIDLIFLCVTGRLILAD